jgi:predicted porin
LQSGNLSTNRWGLKGTEDLGGGLAAVFDLENGFNIDNGKFSNGALKASTSTRPAQQV